MLADWGQTRLTDGNAALHITTERTKDAICMAGVDGIRECAESHKDQDESQQLLKLIAAAQWTGLCQLLFLQPQSADTWSVSVMCKGEVLGKAEAWVQNTGDKESSRGLGSSSVMWP